MFSVPHLVIIFIVVLVVFGPHKLPELARSLGKMMAEFRKASTDFKMAFEEEMRTIERQAREVELKKAEAAAKVANTEQQPAMFGTPADANTSHISSGANSSPEPKISPVGEAIPHDASADLEFTAAENSGAAVSAPAEAIANAEEGSSGGAAETAAYQPPVTEGTASPDPNAEVADAKVANAEPGGAPRNSADSDVLPAHDHRQPA